MATAADRRRPNVLITGTPGTGKSTLAGQLCDECEMRHVNIGEIVKEHKFYEEYDEKYECHVLDEDKLLDFIEEFMDKPAGGCVVDYHGSDFFPERWFDLIVVLRTDNTVLYDRLLQRGYSITKVQENVQCEIFGTVCDEARAAYKQDLIKEFACNSIDEMQSALDFCTSFVRDWHAGYTVNEHCDKLGLSADSNGQEMET